MAMMKKIHKKKSCTTCTSEELLNGREYVWERDEGKANESLHWRAGLRASSCAGLSVCILCHFAPKCLADFKFRLFIFVSFHISRMERVHSHCACATNK